MPYMIDGHNLVPLMGLQLTSMDDEIELVEDLQEFCRIQRTQVEVYFDGAPPGTPSLRRMGAVTAHFIRIGSTADEAIEGRLTRLGKQARGWTVVSSDKRVQAAGRAVHARILSSEEFARKVRGGSKTTEPKPVKELNPEEIQEWINLFNKRK
mgnify:CR=1 FL=1